VAKLIKAFGYALKGIGLSLKQRNFKIQLVCAVGVVALGLYFGITVTEWCILLICIALVLALEILNSALEYLVDLVSPGFNETAGKIKDFSAGAVLVMAIMAALVGILIFWKYFALLLNV